MGSGKEEDTGVKKEGLNAIENGSEISFSRIRLRSVSYARHVASGCLIEDKKEA
jgi:hypothetical protein